VNGRQIGPYVLEAELGSGGMGTVYRAQGADGPVALKLLHPHLLSSPGAFKRFLREAELGRRVVHENVVRTLDIDVTEIDGRSHYFLVMEFVEGQTLRQLLEELGQVPEALCRHITGSIADALGAIHAAGAVHRDLKPENVLITPAHVVKVMDLGIALLVDEALRLSQTGHFLGSVPYAAPEQWLFDSEVDARADLFSVGVMLYELATGRHPFRGLGDRSLGPPNLADVRPAGSVNPQLSPFFEELAACLMAPAPAARLSSAAELAHVVREAENSTWWHGRAPALRRETRHPLRRIRVPRETPLLGREAELAALREAFDLARAGEGRVVLLEGEAGIGKTRLVDEFVGTVEREGSDLSFLFGSYPPGGAATAAGAFSTAYREHFGAERLEEALAAHLPATVGLVPAFAALLRGTAPPEGTAPLDKSSLQTVFIQATRSLAQERPVIVLIDDLHFAPPEGLALFTALSLAAPGHRILLIGTARKLPEDWSASLNRPGHVARLELARLGPRDLTRLLAEALHSESLARQLGWQIAAKSDGNPFFVFEILQDLRRRGVLTQVGGRWSTTSALEHIDVPSSITDLVKTRLAALSNEDRDVLEVAACIGFEFDPSLVAEATGAPLLPTLKRFARIEAAHRLVRAVGRHYAFDHHQLQESLYGSLFSQIKEQYHVAIAEALVKREPRNAVAICEHYFRGAAGSRTAPYFEDAIAALGAGHLYAPAAALAQQVLDTEGLVTGARRVELLQTSASSFERSGNYARERANTRAAHELAQALGDKALIARTTRSQAIALMREGKFEECAEIARRAGRLAREVGADRTIASAATTEANALLWLGRAEEALALYHQSHAIDTRLGDPQRQIIDLGNIGRTMALLGEVEEGLAKEREALALARTHRIAWAQCTLCANVGVGEITQGRIASALAYLDESLAQCQRTGNRHSEAVALVNLGGAYATLGEAGRARDWLERSLALCREIDVPRVESYVWLALARVHDLEGEVARARETGATALALRRELKYGMGLAECLIDAARRAEGAEAAALLDEAVRQAREHQQGGELWLAQAHRARLGLPPLADAPTGDMELLSLERRIEGCRAWYEATGEDRWRDAARARLETLVANAPEQYRASMVERVPLYRAVRDA